MKVSISKMAGFRRTRKPRWRSHVFTRSIQPVWRIFCTFGECHVISSTVFTLIKIFSLDQWSYIVLLELVGQVLLSCATWFVILLKRMVLNLLSISKTLSNIAGESIWIRDPRTAWSMDRGFLRIQWVDIKNKFQRTSSWNGSNRRSIQVYLSGDWTSRE